MILKLFSGLVFKREYIRKAKVFIGILLALLYHSSVNAQCPPGILADESIQLSDHLVEDTTRVHLLNYYSGQLGIPLEKARKNAHKAISLSKKLGFVEGEARAYVMLGHPFFFQEKIDSALHYYEKSYDLFEEIDDARGKTFAQAGIASVLAKEGRFKEAQRMFLNIVAFYENNHLYEKLGSVYDKIGSMYEEQGELEMALFNFDKSIELQKQYPDCQQILGTYINYARAFVNMGRPEQALAQVQKGMEIEEEEKTLYSPLFLVKGRIFNETGDYKEAEKHLLTAIEYSKRTGYVRGEIMAHQLLAKNKLDQKDYAPAKEEAITALGLFESHNIPERQQKANLFQLLARIERNLQNYKAGLAYALKAKKISDSLYQQKTVSTIAELQTIYESEKKERIIRLLEAKNKTARFQILLAIVIGIALLITVSLYFCISNKRRAEKRNLEVESIKRELQNFATLIIEKNSFMTNTIEKLREMGRKVRASESKKEISTLIDSLYHNVNLTWDDQHLTKRIDQVNSGFFTELELQVGKLTKNEKRIASLVQMELSNKEIGSILSINSRSVAQARYRLKKKTNLGPDESLAEYLKKVH